MKTRTDMPQAPRPEDKPENTTFASEALRMAGKSSEEVRRMGDVDRADDRVEALFQARYQTVNSPVHRAIWSEGADPELFGLAAAPIPPSEDAAQVMQRSLEVVRRHKQAGTYLDANKKIAPHVLDALAEVGYWGLLIEKKYGGSEAPFHQFATFLTQMATIDPTIAGLASVHGCIGAVDPLVTFGNDEQKSRLLPKLARGQRLSAFALTEPGAGSDLTALRTTAVLDGDDYVLHGEKLFITNVLPGRMIGVVCLIDDEPAVLIAELPMEEDETFHLKRYSLYALRQAHNYGIVFDGFRVPAKNRLVPKQGDGLTIAYHGLNRGRIALCATAAGTMRIMLADMLPWARFRKTYGEAIARRELVQRRIGHLAGLIVASDALVHWCSSLMDQGYRGEMECIVAKIFGSEAQKEAAIELHMKTHGGRSFLHGHFFGDNVHEFLAPCIYEGEGEMLGMAFFKSLVKQHGRAYFEPIGRALQDAGIRQPNLANPAHLWALKGPLAHYSRWWLGERFRFGSAPALPKLPAPLGEHARWAIRFLRDSRYEISATMRKHQLRLADRQCRMAELSGRVQLGIVMLVTTLYAARQQDPLVREAAACLVDRYRAQLQGQRLSDAYFRSVGKLGAAIAEQGFLDTSRIDAGEILMPYEP
jgi:alkylation response protein AidB-like acyl-CoA dehydrogenase